MNFAERLAKVPKDVLVDWIASRPMLSERLVKSIEHAAAVRAAEARWRAAETKVATSWEAYGAALERARAAVDPEEGLVEWGAVGVALTAHQKAFAAEHRAYDRYSRAINEV